MLLAPVVWLLELFAPGPRHNTRPGGPSAAAVRDPIRDADRRKTVEKALRVPHFEIGLRYAVAANRRPVHQTNATAQPADRRLHRARAHGRGGRRHLHRPQPVAPNADETPGRDARRSPAAARVPDLGSRTRRPRRSTARPRRGRPGPGPGQSDAPPVAGPRRWAKREDPRPTPRSAATPSASRSPDARYHMHMVGATGVGKIHPAARHDRRRTSKPDAAPSSSTRTAT